MDPRMIKFLVIDECQQSNDECELLLRIRSYTMSMLHAVMSVQNRTNKFDHTGVIRAFLNNPNENDPHEVEDTLLDAVSHLQLNSFQPAHVEKVKKFVSLLIRRKMLGDPHIRKGVLHIILDIGFADLFRELLSRDEFNLAEVTHNYGVQPVLVSLFHWYLAERRKTEKSEGIVTEEKDWEISACLRLGIEAGLSTQCRGSVHQYWKYSFHFNLVEKAALEGHVELMALMYRVGVTCYHELFRMNAWMAISAMVSPLSYFKHRTEEVEACIHRLTSAPRSLQDICRLEVSFLIGCRADRKHRALSLGLPHHLARLVLFHDILYDD